MKLVAADTFYERLACLSRTELIEAARASMVYLLIDDFQRAHLLQGPAVDRAACELVLEVARRRGVIVSPMGCLVHVPTTARRLGFVETSPWKADQCDLKLT